MKAFFINQGEQLEVEDTSEMFKILNRSGNRRVNEDGSEYIEPTEETSEVEPAEVITAPEAGAQTKKQDSKGSKSKAKAPAPKKAASKPTSEKEAPEVITSVTAAKGKDGEIKTPAEETPAK
jgi:hypothetical protein